MTGPEITQFSTALATVCLPFQLDNALDQIGQGPLHDYAAPNPYPAQVRQMVLVANSDHWLFKLTTHVFRQYADATPFKTFLAEHPDFNEQQVFAQQNPYSAHLLIAGDVLIGRQTVRQHLHAMRTPTEPKILFVNSLHSQVGKTYTARFLRYLQFVNPENHVAIIDLAERPYTPETLTEDIARDLGLSPTASTPSWEQATRSIKSLSVSLVPAPSNVVEPICWIVFDGFHNCVLAEGVTQFIEQIILRVRANPRYRLVFIDYPPPISFELKQFSFRDNVERATDEEISSFISAIYATHHGAPPSPAACLGYLAALKELISQYQAEYPELDQSQSLLNAAASQMARSLAHA